jgi:hypothetical protein
MTSRLEMIGGLSSDKSQKTPGNRVAGKDVMARIGRSDQAR